MIVNFNLLQDELSWNASIHQLNSDILLRHILTKANIGNVDINFSYCEKKHEGNIINSDNQLIGNFSISF